MGFYASLVPSTGLAKDASGFHLGQGWEYARDFIGAYHLWFTAILIVVTIVLRLRQQDRRMAIATFAMLAAALFHASYITTSGGDYMHGRLLLPAFFAFALPASIALQSASRRVGVFTAVLAGAALVWAVTSVVAFRPPPNEFAFVADISDWRQGSGATVKPKDFSFGLNGLEAAAAYDRGERGYFRIVDKEPRPGRDPNAFVLTLGSIGVPAYNAGREVHVIDIGGLAEALAARTDPIPGRPAGHRKQVDPAWYDARFGAEPGGPTVAAARHALECDPVDGLLDAISDDLTPGRFISNIWHSVSYTRLHVPSDPRVAESRWCRGEE
jgi:arabinofuranosyltransferase